ncbi:Ca2+-binding RTX toxin-like protein [Sagittula marina]|uniref:Ca2+-binding RTX toxin-like protein n=1 Tax=Sagittula marina TaxID=943940 RepID=A0A7W6DP54_9RHOB|nr:hypothetical protein [Sagittula marina]MBB3986362.1 Ca2+-binding RTX toxin-like protein [Sagittula marina]
MIAILLGFGLLGLVVGGVFDSDDDSATAEDDAARDVGPSLEATEELYVRDEPIDSDSLEYRDRIGYPSFSDVAEDLEDNYGAPIEDREDYMDLLASLQGGPIYPTLGTENADRMTGGDDDEDFYAWEGDDTIFMGGGDDFYTPIFENEDAGDDFIRGGSGNDVIYSQIGSDTLRGDAGDDYLTARDLTGRGEPDMVYGGFGNDVVMGDDGDTLSGGEGADFFGIYLPTGDVDPVVVSDFDAAEDDLMIYVETDVPQASVDYTVSVTEEDGDSVVSVDARTVARFSGVTGLDPSLIRVGNYRVG